MLRRFSINFAVLSMLLDFMFVIIGLWFSTIIRPHLNRFSFIQPVPVEFYLPWVLYLIFPTIWIGIFTAFSIYDGRKKLGTVDEYTLLTLATILAGISLAGVLFLSFRMVSRALFVFFVIIVYILLLGWRALTRAFFRLRREWPLSPRRILIVGSGPLGLRVYDQLQKAGIGNLTCVGFVDDVRDDVDPPSGAMLGGFDDIRDVIARHEISEVVIALPHSVYQRLGEVVSLMVDLPVKVWLVLGFFDLALYKMGIDELGGIPTLDLRAAALSEYQLVIKRGFDLIFGGLTLLLSLPLMGLIALAIWLKDGSPILHIQQRAGENGRLFKMYKFRTMVKNAEELRSQVEHQDENGNLVHKTSHDPRVTRLGRVLRRLSLDELPQLFNVVLGTMSLVGPRPELPYLVEKYQPWQRKRFAVPPGITGWWQVTGRSEHVMHLHTEDDLHYINNYSLWLDVQILIRTAWIALLGRGAF